MATTPDVADQTIKFTPDFLQIPSIVGFDTDLQPLDKLVYAVVFWLERLRDGRCYASNATIAKVVGSSSSGVANSLVRLREKNYIVSYYNEKGGRTEIRTLVYNSVNPYSNEEGGLTQMSNIDNKKKESISSETLEQITKIYKLWCIYMIVDPELRSDGTPDARSAALLAATKRYRLTPKRRDAVARRLKDAGYDQIIRAIKSISQSPFHRDGINDRGEEGTWKASLEWLCGSYEKVEEWANKYPSNGGES
jgi:hypothetical protein